jgi:hypothetical protein
MMELERELRMDMWLWSLFGASLDSTGDIPKPNEEFHDETVALPGSLIRIACNDNWSCGRTARYGRPPLTGTPASTFRQPTSR